MSAVVGADFHKIPEDRRRLIRLPPTFQHMGQGVHRLRAEETGHHVIADCWLRTFQGDQAIAELEVQPDVAGMAPQALPQYGLGGVQVAGIAKPRLSRLKLSEGKSPEAAERANCCKVEVRSLPLSFWSASRSWSRHGSRSAA